jgi:S-methylmethionine-dependent homocysteine/selenocysteine methylase
MKDIDYIINNSFVLTEGSIIERLTHEFHINMDAELFNAVLVLDTKKKFILKQIYKEYIDVAVEFGVPIFIFTPTWKVNAKSCNWNKAKLAHLIRQCCEFMFEIKNEYITYDNIYIGGLVGVLNDSYDPSMSLSIENSYNFHKTTIEEFIINKKYINFIIASTLPSLSESLGIAKAISDFSIPYILSFVIRSNGEILDGILLTDVIEQIDNHVKNIPLGYMVNCVHPQNVLYGFENILKKIPNNRKKYFFRIKGIQGNTSKLSPEELDCSTETYKDDALSFAHDNFKLKNIYNLNIFGGCCGTDKSHIYSIAELFVNNSY